MLWSLSTSALSVTLILACCATVTVDRLRPADAATAISGPMAVAL